MLYLALSVVLCLFVRGGTGQFQEVRPFFCPSSELVGATCDDSTTVETPAAIAFETQVNHLRCHTGCLMDRNLNILEDYVVDEEDVWTSFNSTSLGMSEQEQLNECRQQCLLFGAFREFVNSQFTVMQCQATLCGVTTNREAMDREACNIGCSIGNMVFGNQAGDNPDLAPVQPTGTPPIFFDTQSSDPWEFSLNLSAVAPTNTTQLRPNASAPVIHGFVLQIIVEQNGMNTTHNFYMYDPSGPGSVEFSTFLSIFRCQLMYLSIAVVNFYGRTNLTEFTRTCIPGTYSVIEAPTLQFSSILVKQGDLPNPSLGSIIVNWFEPDPFPLFGDPTYEVSASYIKQSEELDMMCQPDGGDVEFRERNISGLQITIESGPHGNIQLLPPGIDPCVYRVTLEALWVGPNVTIPFLQNFRQMLPRTVEIEYVPDDQPDVRVLASVSNASGDGFYSFSNDSSVVLDPPVKDFFESFNAINWTISRLDRTGASNNVKVVIQENPMIFPHPPPDSIRNVMLSPLAVGESYLLDVQLVRAEGFPGVRRNYLRIPRTIQRGVIDSTMARPIPPGPLRNVTVTGCSIDGETNNTSLQVAWQLPEMSFGKLVNCSFNISVMEDTMENATLLFVNGASESPEDRNSSLTLPSPMNYSSYLFIVTMFCINEHGLSTPQSTSDTFNGSDCAVVALPSPSPSTPSVHMIPTTSEISTTSEIPPTVEPTSPFRTEYSIIIGAAVGLFVALLLLVILIGCYCIWRRRRQRTSLVWEMKRTRSILRKARVSASSVDEWEMDPNHLYMREKLGEGNFGEVYQASIAEEVECVKAKKYVDEMSKVNKTPTMCTVAVKLLKPNAPGETRQSFLNEINMMKKVARGNSFNVVRMVGCVSVQSPYALVLEYVPYGSLLDYLRENRKLAQRRRQLKRMMQLAKESSRKKQQIGGGDGAAFGGLLPRIEEASLHSLDSASAQYLSHSELNPGGVSSDDSCFSHSAPANAPRSPALLDFEGARDRAQSNDYLGVGQLEAARASPYEEPLQLGFLPDSSDLGHNRPASYIQPISSPTQILFAASSQKSDDSEPVVLSSETGTPKKSAPSSALNPLYEDPEIKNPYPDLGELEAVNLMMFAYQIASGMEYLASLGIVHRDLACRNVLVDRDKILKISDFGLSRETDLYVSSSQGRLPLRWMSPEAILDRVFTEKSDVWAYGITIWEICTLGGYPYATTPNSELLQSLLEGYRMERPDNCSEQIYRIMLDCWHIEPEERPLFKQLKSDLDKLLMVHQPDECIKFSEIDEEKLPYYKRGVSNSENSGGSTEDDALLNVPKVLNSYTPTCTLRSTGASHETTERVVPAEVVRVGNGTIPIVIPISPQSSDGTIKGDEERQRNNHDDDLNAEPSETALTAQGSASTIRDDSGNEETKL